MRRFLIPITVLLGSTGMWAADYPERTELLKKAAEIRPRGADFVWQQIPWHTEAGSALKEAKAENRPLFVWLAGGRDRDGSPLERC
jgi:hypothetical protein